MNGQLTSSRNWERIVGAAIVGGRACHFILQGRWGGTWMEPFRRNGMGCVRGIAPGYPGGLAMRADVFC